MSVQKTLVVIGGGAAGFFCAVNAARLYSGLRVILLEKTGKLLQKVKISGGGRCNVTHRLYDIGPLSKCYPRGEKFVKKAFHHFGPADTVAWFAERGVRLKTESDGRIFPVNDSSQTIIDCLLQEAEKYGAGIWLHAAVSELRPSGIKWLVGLQDGRVLFADYVCVATGGFTKPDQFSWLIRNTDHTVSPPVPSLFTFNTPKHPITTLMGVVQEAHVKIAGTKFESEGPVLITHWGLSGPAVLRTSAFAAKVLAEKNYRFEVVINWLPGFNENSLRDKILSYRMERGSRKVVNTEWLAMPDRLLRFLLHSCDIQEEQRWSDLPGSKQNKLIKAITCFTIEANGKTTFKEEFVTAGGINLSEIEPSSMQSRLHKGLYFAGEIMDVDGITGGFNFQHAWTSAMVAARHISGK